MVVELSDNIALIIAHVNWKFSKLLQFCRFFGIFRNFLPSKFLKNIIVIDTVLSKAIKSKDNCRVNSNSK